MLMPESVLAALIAGTATLSASFLQLRSALLRDGGRGPSAAARRKNRLQLIIFFVIVGGSAAAGFALSQWLTAGERAAQSALQRELQERVAEISRTTSQLELTRGSERAEIESGVLRRIGTEGVVIAATVAACHPALVVNPPGATSPPGAATDTPPPAARTCTEAEASPVTLCAAIPGDANVTEVALFSRPADSDTPWSSSRYLPGQEAGQARFAEKYSESTPEAGARQVCQEFAHWSAEHARAVRMIVRYSLPALTAHN
jgi:hypothetical protein